MTVINTGKAYRQGTATVQRLYAGTTRVWPPTPVITSVSPTEYHHNDAVQQMTVNGTGFLPTSQVLLNNVVQNAMTYVSATQVKANVDPANTGTADLSWPVVVRNPSNVNSAAKNITVVPEPTLTSISPTSRYTTDPETTITATGTNFTPECKLRAGTTVLSGSTFVNRTTMTGRAGWNTASTQQINVVDERNHKTADKAFTISTPPPPPTPTVTSAWGSIDPFMGGTIYLEGTNFVAPMTTNLGAMTGFCTLNENYTLGSSSGGTVVDSPTTAHINCIPQDGHNSVAMPDCSHKVRVTTPAGTSPWLDGQSICV